MASTFTTQKLGIEKPAGGDYVGTWSGPINSNWDAIDKGLGGSSTSSVGAGDWTVSSANAQSMRLIPTGTLTANRNVVLPATIGGFWLVTNSATGAFTLTVKTAAGGSTGVTVQQAYTTLVFSDGTNVTYGDAGQLSLYLPLAGGTLTGALALPSNGLNVGSGQLQVAGGNVTVSGNITATGNVTAFSDERLKTNISTIDGATALVQRMRGVRYIMNDRKGVGIIAQEMEKVIPEVVFDAADGYKSVAYANLVGVLIEAVKDLSYRIEQLEKNR